MTLRDVDKDMIRREAEMFGHRVTSLMAATPPYLGHAERVALVVAHMVTEAVGRGR